ncbi:PE family protein [Mycolicibacterium arenosum]|uniref:PE family protein n=1 Tax=Mycolicibacterium arenosum TaxID=2952157 RepID=A0ABT1LZW3_9MYCO|nr:PE family protein [Mycolicibacterium sp. CAU 1645]MCP9271544.1 PE family protein [Mycolicibacterium sp. CAU 1645]
MDNGSGLSIEPAEVTEATRQLDELAHRVELVVKSEAPQLAVTPSGGDEVSQRIALTLNQVHGSFVEASDKGVTEIREVAAALRKHAHDVEASDQDFTV